jgi:NAD-reducing hydrogenase small subunit
MSLLDIDERIIELVELIDFDKSPDRRHQEVHRPVRGGPDRRRLLQRGERGGAAGLPQALRHSDLRRRLRDHGRHSRLRNMVPIEECFQEAYVNGPSVYNPAGVPPDDPEVPLLLDKVYPAHEVVKIDYHLPGCPPPADTLWQALVALLTDQPVELPYQLIKYD